MTSFHYPLPESEPTSPWVDLSDEARSALTRVAMGPSAANQLLKPNGQTSSELAIGFQVVVADTLANLGHLFRAVNLETPRIDGPEFDNVDWAHLQEGYNAYESLNMQPEVVISPEGQPLDFWRKLYHDLTEWQEANQPNTPHRLQRQDDGDGLWVNNEVARNWDSMVPIAANSTLRWKTSVIPGAPKAPALNVTHGEVNNTGPTNDELRSILHALPPGDGAQPHTSIETYLTAQAVRICGGQEPFDPMINSTYFYTWLDGNFTTSGDEQAAPVGYWDPGDGQVGLGWGQVGDRVDNLGARPEVRANLQCGFKPATKHTADIGAYSLRLKQTSLVGNLKLKAKP